MVAHSDSRYNWQLIPPGYLWLAAQGMADARLVGFSVSLERQQMPTSSLQQRVSFLLSTHFGEYTIRENRRPLWLLSKDGYRLELDFFIEELDAAIEVQGRQHYEYIPYFHEDRKGFKRQQERDRIKRQTCKERGIWLIEAWDEPSAWRAILALKSWVDDSRKAWSVDKRAADAFAQCYARLLDLISKGRFPGVRVRRVLQDLWPLIGSTQGAIYYTLPPLEETRAKRVIRHATALQHYEDMRALSKTFELRKINSNGEAKRFLVRATEKTKKLWSPMDKFSQDAVINRTKSGKLICSCLPGDHEGICPHMIRLKMAHTTDYHIMLEAGYEILSIEAVL